MTTYAELFLKGLGVLGKGHVIGPILWMTVAVWCLETVAVYVMLEAFRVKATLLMAAMLIVASNLSFAFPITPGNIGVFQVVNVLLLGTFGVAESSSLAYGIGAQSTTYLIIVGLGMICLYREKMNLNLLGRAAQEDVVEKPIPAVETP